MGVGVVVGVDWGVVDTEGVTEGVIVDKKEGDTEGVVDIVAEGVREGEIEIEGVFDGVIEGNKQYSDNETTPVEDVIKKYGLLFRFIPVVILNTGLVRF